MKSTIRENLQEWIIEEDAVTGESASNRDITAFSGRIKEVTELWKKMLKVTVHREDISASGSRDPVGEGETDSVWGNTMQRFDPVILCRQLFDDFAGSIPTAIIYRNNFMNIIAVERQDSLRQRADIHLFIVRR